MNILFVSKMALLSSDQEFKERLIRTVKKEVKQIMEEAVTRKFVHQDSSSVTSLCAAVESCLSHGLRRRALGLFRSSSTTALMHKVAKSYAPAVTISKLILESEAADGVKRSSSSGDSTTRMLSCSSSSNNSSKGGVKPPLQKRNSGSWLSRSTNTPKFLWIRLALFERILAGIIEHLVDNHQKYYEKDALVADPEYGSVLSHLLVGPCALEYTRMKTQDHYWTDPPADELVQRHRISSGASGGATSPANRRPGLHYRRLQPGGSSGDGDSSGLNAIAVGSGAVRSFPLPNSTAKDYVESLHQNNKVALLYGKNNVLVLPRDLSEPIPGYLSLHHSIDSLTLKWTPNQLMNGAIDSDGMDKSTYWDYALHVNLYDIVYVHCHQQGADEGGSMVLVGQDGVQRPVVHFPAGGHLLAFLTCLETGLHPRGRLDPPLWSQTGKGKVFPKIKRKGPLLMGGTNNDSMMSVDQVSVAPTNGNDEESGSYQSTEPSSDYVFRIIINYGSDQNTAQEMLDDQNTPTNCGTPTSLVQGIMSPRSPRWWTGRHQRPFRSSDSTGSSSSSSKSLSASLSLAEHASPSLIMTNSVFGESSEQSPAKTVIHRGESLQVLCETMKRQIISRAFYGWLAHCRHLRTVRTHLSGLVNENIVSHKEPYDASQGVTDETWQRLVVDGIITDSYELFRLTFYGGVVHHLRKEVWPYLLGHYQFGSTKEERESQDMAMQAAYETTMSEWLAVEAIIRQRDKEVTAASIAKLSQRSQSEQTSGGNNKPPTRTLEHQGKSLSNEVFDGESASEEDYENEAGTSTCTGTEIKPLNEDEQDLPVQTNGNSPIRTDTLATLDPVTLVTTRPSSGSEDTGTRTIVGPTTCYQSDDYAEVNSPQEPEAATATGVASSLKSAVSLHNLGVEADGLDGCSIESRSSCVSPVSSQGGIYSMELLENYGLNLHRIDKDVLRCDRNYHYFTKANLDKLRNIMCTYVWCHLDMGYMQGMCDLVAPLLVILDDEALTYSCFCELMKRMAANFPQGGAMDKHFSNMRSLIQILDAEIFDLMHQNGDYTHFYFCYRWFLLDFKRELIYEDVFTVWETIWAARFAASTHFVLFVALALVQYYRDIILTNAMDFTDIIKFFNEMAERHDAKAMLRIARDLVLQLQTLIENK